MKRRRKTRTLSFNFRRLVLGCIETKFCNPVLVGIGKTLDKIYQIYILLNFVSPVTFHSENHEKCCFEESTGREIMHRRRNNQTAATQRSLVGRDGKNSKKCKGHPALFVRVRTAQIQKMNSCDTGHVAISKMNVFCIILRFTF